MITSEMGITLSALFLVVGGVMGILGVVEKREASKYKNGRESGILESKVDMVLTQLGILNEIKDKQQDHEVRITVLETTKRTRTKSASE